MNFTKYHGLGNDFIIVEDFQGELLPQGAELAQAVCHRQFGIGADGLVLIIRKDGEYTMRIFNADGSEAEMCGNAIRCLADYLLRKNLVAGPVFPIHTLGGTKLIQQEGSLYRVDMGEPGFQGLSPTVEIAVQGRMWTCHPVSMGNPHAVVFVDDVDEINLALWGPLLEKAEVWPQGANIEFTQVLSAHHLKVRVWERGAGPTLACGTGACAAAVAAIREGLVPSPVQVTLPGGDLTIEWEADGRVFMLGPAAQVFSGEVDVQALERGR